MGRMTYSAATSVLHNSSEFSRRSASGAAHPRLTRRHRKAPRTRGRLAMHFRNELHLVWRTPRIANEISYSL